MLGTNQHGSYQIGQELQKALREMEFVVCMWVDLRYTGHHTTTKIINLTSPATVPRAALANSQSSAELSLCRFFLSRDCQVRVTEVRLFVLYYSLGSITVRKAWVSG